MTATRPPAAARTPPAVQTVVIVGAGLGGIAAAIELKRHGFDDLTILEAAPGIGGTWHYNDYPGAACDVPSHLYSYSFAQRASWSRLCSPRAEILGYIKETADAFDITRHVRTRTRVAACTWDDRTARWRLHTEHGDGTTAILDAGAVVLATGQLSQPAYPRLEGLGTFSGASFHSARWDHGYPLTGKRVAVIGTGASAVQLVPEIAGKAGHLTVFQRTGNWFLPRRNSAYPKPVTALLRRVPGARAAWRGFLFRYMESLTVLVRHPRTWGQLGRLRSAWFMRRQLRDPELRRKVWPSYPYGCKRVLFSSTFLPALRRPNVDLVTEQIARMTPAGPQTADGRIHEADCVIYATGFRTTEFMFPMAVTGTGGRTLREAWAGGAKAHLGITVAGFPSLFVMYGPNTNTSGGSVIFFLEAQASYLRQALQLARRHNAAAVDVRPEVEAESTAEVQAAFEGTAWTRCDSWYRDARGRVVTNWPRYMRDYARLAGTLDAADYRLIYPAQKPSPARTAEAR